jgi:uncharacterized protein YndB with AHSA1/START domain
MDLHYSEILPHDITRVWAALTTADALRAWLMDNDFQPEIGRAFRFECPPAPGVRGYVECRLLELEPMRRIVWSWHATDEGEPTTVTFELEAVAQGTRITLRHRGDTASDVTARTAEGWGVKLRELGAYVRESSAMTNTDVAVAFLQGGSVRDLGRR